MSANATSVAAAAPIGSPSATRGGRDSWVLGLRQLRQHLEEQRSSHLTDCRSILDLGQVTSTTSRLASSTSIELIASRIRASDLPPFVPCGSILEHRMATG